ncbi:MAG: hypothetical protein KF715_04090 [Candidatus Didemnitutus sp.]|nr:hypothetical protein [Candidatus Didemnitutus sp.]
MKPPPPNALVNKVVLLTLVLLMFAGTLGLGAVWVRQEIFATANRIRVLEGESADIDRKLDEVGAQIATAESVAALLQQNDSLHLGLATAKEVQVVRVERDPVLELGRKRSAEAIFNSAAAAQNANAFAFRVIPASYQR